MKKERLKFSVLIFSAILFIIAGFSFKPSSKYSARLIDNESLDALKEKRTLVPGTEEGLFFDDQKLFFDRHSDAYYYSINRLEGSSYDPVVTLNKVGNMKKKSIAFSDRPITDELIRSGTAIPFITYDEDSYSVYKLFVTTLPLINIEYSEEIGDEDTDMVFTFYDNKRDEYLKTRGAIHIRGNVSRNYPKNNYRISLKSFSPADHLRKFPTSILGLSANSEYALYSGYNDTDKVRNVFCQNLWYESMANDNSYNLNFGTEYRYLELFMNGSYYGLYAIAPVFNEKDIGLSSNLRTQTLFKLMDWITDYPEPDEVGMIKGFDIKHNVDYFRELPDEGSIFLHSYEKLRDYFDILNSNRQNSDLLLEGIDLDNALDFYLFVHLVQGVDTVREPGELRNAYIALSYNSENIVALYAPWDIDISFGAWWTDLHGGKNNYFYSPEDDFLWENGYLNQLIKNNDAGIKEKLCEKYRKLREDKWADEAILKMLEEYEKKIFDSGAYERDMERWTEDEYEDPKLKLTVFKDYVLKRFKHMDRIYLEDN